MHKPNGNRLAAFSCGVLLATAIATPVVAQDGSSEEAEPVYHERIIVTAQKIEENILEVPMTITAFDADALKDNVLQDKTDLQNLVPGLQFGDEMDQEGQGTVIRGIGTRIAGQSHTDRAVANYVDGVYTVGVYGLLPGGGFDLDRIEVARGPQGTLNGRNSIAGSINYVYRKPSAEQVNEVMFEITDVSQQRLNVGWGTSLGEQLSFRITAGLHQGDGRQKNIGHGGDYDKPDQTFLAPQIRFQTERFDMNLRIAKLEDQGSPRSLVPLSNLNRTDPMVTLGPQGGQFAAPPPGASAIPNDLYLYETPNPAIEANCPIGEPGFRCGDINNMVALNFTGSQESEGDLTTFYAEYDLTDQLTLRYNYSKNDATMINIKDADYANRISTPEDHQVASDGLVSPFEDTHYILPYLYDEKSQEIQISSNFGGDFEFIAGYFTYENSTLFDLIRVDLTRPFRFGSADEQARAASPIFGFVPVNSCQELLTGVVEAFDIGTADPNQADDWDGLYWYCPEGNEHTETVRFYTGATSETEATFISGTYQLDERWSVSGGLRHTADEKSQRPEAGGGFAILEIGSIVGVFFPNGGADGTHTWDKTIGHVSLEFAPDDNIMYYGRLSTGYRSGGFNTPIPGVDLPFVGEETLVNYEAGIKGLFFDSKLQFVTGFWYNDFDGYQLSGLQPPPEGFMLPSWSETPLAEFTSNIDGTTIWGLDVEYSYWLNDQWRVSGFYAYQDSELGEHSSVVWGNPDAEYALWTYLDFDTGEEVSAYYPLASDLTGNELPMQPHHKFATTVAYNTEVAFGGKVNAQATWSFIGEQHPNIGNNPEYVMPSYSRVDANLNWTSQDEKVSVLLFIQNLFDEIGLVEYLPISGLGSNPSIGYPTNPREMGVQLRWQP